MADLPEDAARALARIRATARILRFEVRKACEQERWRLKVVYAPPGGEAAPVQLGLLWSEDREAVRALAARLRAEHRAGETVES
jgi:predicted N-formylglutamate amidohydrolase